MESKSVVRAIMGAMPYIAYTLPTATCAGFNSTEIARARKRGQRQRARHRRRK